MKVFSKHKSTCRQAGTKLKGLAGLVLGFAMIAQLFNFAPTVKAASDPNGPRFNFLSGDRELLSGKNRTTNQADWSAPVAGTAGDTFAGLVYYHNGMINTTATNVRIKVNMPSKTTNKTAVLTASVSADNADTITNTVVDGSTVGQSGLTINLNEDANLALVPGSIQWFPEFTSLSVPSHVLPAGQSGDTLTTSGVSVGNVQGCWPHVGYISFLVKTDKSAQPAMTVDKTVRNITVGETAFVEKNYAKPGDILEYQVVVKNTGLGSASNLYVTDSIPAGTSYIAGSTVIGSTVVADGIIGDGLTLGNLGSNQSAIVKFRVKVNQNVKNGATLLNTVSLYINKQVLTDTATTIVKFGVTTPVVGGSLPVTGGESVIFTLLALASAGLFGVYRKSRKTLIAKTW